MPMKCLPRLGVGVLVPLVTGACGFFAMRGPPENYQDMAYFTCTSGNSGAILDLVMVGTSAAWMVFVIASQGTDSDAVPTYQPAPAIAMGVGSIVLFGFSAKAGFQKSKQCRAAIADFAGQYKASAANLSSWQMLTQVERALPDALVTRVPGFPVRMISDGPEPWSGR